jgi:hypothetical protein
VRTAVARLAVCPVVLAAAIAIGVSGWSIVYRLTLPYPQNPWESAILADAFRASRGQDVYEPLHGGHATHMYGPAISQTIGLIFSATGPNLHAGRAVSLVCALALCGLLIWVFANRRDPLELFLAAGLMLSLHYRALGYFAETRPDMIALLLATLAIVCFFRGHHGTAAASLISSMRWYVPGLLLTIAAFLFKQTYACCAAVPILAVLLTRPRPLARHLAMALSPVAAMVLLLVSMHHLAPLVFFYTVSVPSLYPLVKGRLLLGAAYALAFSPLFLILASSYALRPGRETEARDRSPAMHWLVASLAVGAATGTFAFAKAGGSLNSLLLAWVPMTAFTIAKLSEVLQSLRDAGDDRRPLGPLLTPLVAGCLLAVVIVVQTFGVRPASSINWGYGHGDAAHAQVVEAVRQLNGHVASVDDPTITILARGEVGASLDAELDATGRRIMPPRITAELSRADWLVRVSSNFDGNRLSGQLLEELGFERAATIGTSYTLWRRATRASRDGDG